MKRIEYTPQDFAWTQWTPEEIEKVADEVIAFKKQAYEKVKNVPEGERIFENTVYAIEASNHCVTDIHRIILLMNVSPLKEVRNAAQKASERIEKALVDIEYDEDLYRAVKEYEAKKEKLEGEDAKLFRDMLREYRRMGFELPVETRSKLKNNLKRLSELGNEFEKNINEYEDSIEVTREELDGLSEGYIAHLKQTDEGKYKVTLDYPDYFPFMENARNAVKREELARKNLQKGGKRNVEILRELIQLRDENAKLLGYPNHGEFRLEVRMAKRSENVFHFIHDLTGKLSDGLAREMQELRAYKARLTGDENAKVHFWDVTYFLSQLKKEKFSVDNEGVREYFPLEKVKSGLLRMYAELLSVTFEKLEGYPLWHEDVELYVVRDLDGSLLSYFLLDLYPREGKYGHAAVFDVVIGHQSDYAGENYIAPVAPLVTNFAKPTAGHPSLMSHAEVETFFHEFGHVMHEVLTKARYISQAGTCVSRDFVEAPSQMLENWVWDKEMLGIISGHYLTGEKLPDEVIDNMIRAKNHGEAYATMRQMAMSLFDLEMHTHTLQSELDEEFGEMFAKYTGIHLPHDQTFLAGWGHLVGYDAGYYSYMWSKVYSSDMFTRFKQEGLLNKKTGMDYRQWILEKGSSMEEMDLVRGFLGRDPNNEAFLEEIGLKG